MTAPSSTPGSNGESPGDDAGRALNGASLSAANGNARDGHAATPQSRRERRERERNIVTGTRLLPNQPDVPAEDHEPADDEGTDLAAITPPPRPAPRASAFRGLRYIESRKRLGELPDDAAPVVSAAQAADEPKPSEPAPPAAKRPAARPVASPVRGSAKPPIAVGKLEPPRWPTPPVFMPPERPAVRSRTTRDPKPAAGPATSIEESAVPVVSEPAVEVRAAEPDPVPEPIAAEPVIPEPAAAEPAAAEPPVPEPFVPEPVVPEPVAAEPVVPEPVVPEPVVAPVVDVPQPEPAAPEPAIAESVPIERVEAEADPIIAALVRTEPGPPVVTAAATRSPQPASRREARALAAARAAATRASAAPVRAQSSVPSSTPAATPAATRSRPSGRNDTGRRPARPAPPGRSAARRLKAVLSLIPVLGTLATLAVLLYGAMTIPGRPLLGAVLAVAAAAALVVIVITCIEVNRATPLPLIGADLSHSEHLRLWSTVDAAADDLRVEAPIRIVVDGAARAALSRRPAGPELVVGLPLLLGLSEAELSAVLIHELAHDAAPGAGVHRLGERVDATIRQLSGDRRWSRRPSRLMIRGYAWLYERLATGTNERHELRADDLAAELTSAPITASAIRRTELIRDRWQILVTRYVPLSAVARRRAPLAAGLRSLLDVTAAATPEPDAGVRLPFDTHQSPAQRAARLSPDDPDDPADDHAARSGSAATALLAGGEDGLRTLERAVLPDDDPDADWQTIVQIAAELQAQERTGHLAWAMHEFSPHTPVTLRAVLAAVGAGEGPQIVGPLLRPGLTAQQRAAAAQATLEELITAFVVTVLLRSGRALHEVSWPGAVRLLRRSGTAWRDWDGDEPIRSGTADPAGGAALNRWLRDIQADLDAVALPSAGPPLHTLSALSDLELTLPFENRAVDLLIYRTGVLLAPIEVPTPAVRLAQQATNTLRRQSPARVAAQRIISIAEQVGESPQDLPGGWWIPLNTVVRGHIRERRGGVEITLRLSGGASSISRTTNRTSVRGTAMEDLVRLLPILTGDRPASSELSND